MPYLGDYLGHLLSEVTIARVQADLEAVRVAELYANNPLLRNMPVPRFRLPTMTLDVPVVIKEMEKAKTGEVALRERFNRLLDQYIASTEITLAEEEKASLDKILNQTITDRINQSGDSANIIEIADELASIAIKALPGHRRPDAVNLKQLNESFKAAVRSEFLNFKEAPPRLSVLVTTAELRETAPKELLAHLHLSISEEAFEWTMIESQGKSVNRLVPE